MEGSILAVRGKVFFFKYGQYIVLRMLYLYVGMFVLKDMQQPTGRAAIINKRVGMRRRSGESNDDVHILYGLIWQQLWPESHSTRALFQILI